MFASAITYLIPSNFLEKIKKNFVVCSLLRHFLRKLNLLNKIKLCGIINKIKVQPFPILE